MSFSLENTDAKMRSVSASQTYVGAMSSWVNEIGEINRTVIMGNQTIAGSDIIMKESNTNPFIVRKDSKSHFIFRVRNAIWAKDVYNVSIESNQIVIRTTNKKYFSKLKVPDLERLNVKLDPSFLCFDWSDNVLVITYLKPKVVLDMEMKESKERAKTDSKSSKEDQVQCPQS